MSLNNLADALRSQLPIDGQGSITLDGPILDTAGGVNTADVVQSLQNYLGLSLPILQISGLSRTDILDPPPGDPLIISNGTVEFLNVEMSVKALQFDLEKTILSLFLQTINFPNEWTLATSFPSLLVFPMLNGHLLSPTFLFASEPRNNWNVNDEHDVDLERGLNFYATIKADTIGAIQELVNNFLSLMGIEALNEFYLFGQIDLTKIISGRFVQFPMINLISPLFGDLDMVYTIFGFLKVKSPRLGLRIVKFEVSEPGETEEVFQDAAPDFYFELPIKLNDIDLAFSASLFNGSSSMIFAVTNPGENALTPGTLFQLMAGEDWLQKVPPPLLAALSSIKFYGFMMTVFLGSKATENLAATFNVASIRTSIGSTTPIDVFGPFKEFEFWVNWTILYPTDKEQMQSLLSFHAEVDMEGIGKFNIEIAQT